MKIWSGILTSYLALCQWAWLVGCQWLVRLDLLLCFKIIIIITKIKINLGEGFYGNLIIFQFFGPMWKVVIGYKWHVDLAKVPCQLNVVKPYLKELNDSKAYSAPKDKLQMTIILHNPKCHQWHLRALKPPLCEPKYVTQNSKSVTSKMLIVNTIIAIWFLHKLPQNATYKNNNHTYCRDWEPHTTL